MRTLHGFRFKIFLALLVLIAQAVPPETFAQPPRRNDNWIPNFTAAAGPLDRGAVFSAVDVNGNIYIAGPVPQGAPFAIRVAKWNGARWEILGQRLEHTLGAISLNAIAVAANGDVYIGGHFDRAFNSSGRAVTTNNIARWSASAGEWQAVGDGIQIDGYVHALAVDANNHVYAGGIFLEGYNAPGVAVPLNFIGRWNNTANQWEPLGEGTTDGISALAIDAQGGIIAGGQFQYVKNAGGTSVLVNGVARWDGANWQALGQGLAFNPNNPSQIISTIAADANGNVFCAGNVDAMLNNDGSTAAGPVVKWDGSRWSNLAPTQNIAVMKLAYDNSGRLFSLFLNYNTGKTAVERWNGTAWSRIAQSLGVTELNTIAANPQFVSGEYLYLGGKYEEFENPFLGVTEKIRNNALWNQGRWQPLTTPIGAPGGEIYAVASDDPVHSMHFYAGGLFAAIDGVAASNIARFDGAVWQALGGVNGPVYAIQPVGAPQGLGIPELGVFIGGEFSEAVNPDGSLVSVANLAFWSERQQRWFSIGGFDGPVYALAYARSELYAGGAFTRVINGPLAARIAKWDFFSQQWEPLGQGFLSAYTPEVRALAIGIAGSVLNYSWINVYVGGSFSEAYNADGSRVACRNLMLWDGRDQKWRPVGDGTDDEVLALALPGQSYYDPLYVGGRFRTGYNDDGSLENIDRIAMWDGHRWQKLGNGVNGAVTTIAPSFDRTQIYAGGEFTEATNSNNSVKAVNHIAVFERTNYPGVASQWDTLGSGTNDFVYSLASLWPCPRNSASEVLYVGGAFTQAGNKNAAALAKWKCLRPYTSRGNGVAIVAYSSGRSSGPGRRSRVVLTTSLDFCSTGIGKAASPQDEIIFDNLGFGEAAELPALPYLEPFTLRHYDVEDLSQPLATYNDIVVTSENPQMLMLMGVDDTTAFAPNPEGYSIRATMLLQDLPILTNRANEVRVVFAHAVTDAPTVDLVATNDDTMVSNLNYGAASQSISIAAGSYTVDVLRSSDKQKLGTHTLDVSNKANSYVVITLSGFLNPAANQNGPVAALGVYEIKLTPATAVEEREETTPVSFELRQNYPNPFNPVTSIQYSVASDQFVSLKAYDVLGREVTTLVNEKKPAGTYRVSFDTTGIASGIYFYQMKAGEFVSTRKMLHVR